MANNEFLNEEKYQQTNIKVKKTGKILLIIGIITLVISFLLIIVGFISAGNSAMNGANDTKNEMIDNFNSFTNSIMDDSVDNNDVTIDIDTPTTENNGIFGGIGLLALGGIMIPVGFVLTIAGGLIMFFAHRREIISYTTQQVMPVAQEGIEKMAPTIGKAAGDIAKGIKQGLNDADNSQN